MTPLDIITAATRTGAEFLGAQDRLGTLAAGKQADLILVSGDPTQNVSDLDNVDRVMLGRQVGEE